MNSLTWYTGEVGSKVVAALKGQVEAGTFGETLKEASTFSPPLDPNQSQPAPPAQEPNDKNHSHPGQLSPGIMFLGTTARGTRPPSASGRQPT